MKVVGFKAPFRREGLRNKDLEHTAGNAHHALIFADANAELDDGALSVPPGIGRKAKEHEIPPGGNREGSYNVLLPVLREAEICEGTGNRQGQPTHPKRNA